MITDLQTRKVESTLKPIDEAGYHFDPKNMKHIAAILREMYSDPCLAVIREYSANATDAHVLAATPHRPIEITIPTVEKPTAIFRDFGIGLNDDDFKELMLGYGASGEEKRKSQKFIGGFGIGAKCAYAIADQFTFTSYHAGERNVWHCYRDEDDECKAKKLSQTPSSEPSGIEVSIPIPGDLIDTFQQRISTHFRFYSTKPTFFNAPSGLLDHINRALPQVLFSGSLTISSKHESDIPIRWELMEKPDLVWSEYSPNKYSYGLRYNRRGEPRAEVESAVIMGQIAYPLKFEKAFTEENLKIKGLVIHAPIGAFQLAPSRESLSYTTRVRETVKGICTQIISELEASVAARLSSAKTAKELFALISSVESSMPGDLRHLADGKVVKKELAKRDLSVTGYELKRTHAFEQVIYGSARQRYSQALGAYRNSYSTVKLFDQDSYTSYTAPKDSPVVLVTHTDKEAPTNDGKLLLSLVGTYLYPGMTDKKTGMNPLQSCSAFVILVADENKIPDVAWVKDGSVQLVKFQDLPTAADAEWADAIKATATSSPRGGFTPAPRSVFSQHSKKFNKLKEDVTYGATKSQHWEAVKATDVANVDRAVFVFHDRFEPVMSTSMPGCNRANDTFSTFDALKKLGIVDTKEAGIFGLRTAERDWVNKNKTSRNMVEFKDYMLEVIPRIEKTFGITKDQVEAAYYLLLMAQVDRDDVTAGMVPFFLGASQDSTREAELAGLLSPFRGANAPVFEFLIQAMCNTTHGKYLVNQMKFKLPWDIGIPTVATIKKADMSKAQTAFSEFAKRLTATELRKNLCRTVSPQVTGRHQITGPTVDTLYKQTKKDSGNLYELLVQVESLKL